jgi:hypothetical protein
MLFLNKYINKVLIFGLTIIVFYNIFSIFILLSNYKIEGHLAKSFNYLPYKHSIFFNKPLKFSKQLLQAKNSRSKKLYSLINTTEKKSVLDYSYWEMKILYQISNKSDQAEFERDFINLVILSKNNLGKKKSLKLFYLRNIPRLSKEVGDIVISN